MDRPIVFISHISEESAIAVTIKKLIPLNIFSRHHLSAAAILTPLVNFRHYQKRQIHPTFPKNFLATKNVYFLENKAPFGVLFSCRHSSVVEQLQCRRPQVRFLMAD